MKASGWNKGSAASRGYGKLWRKLRKIVMQRDNHLCVVCYAEGKITKAHAVDHIVNKAQGGTDELSNLQAICFDHHQKKTREERGGEWKPRGAGIDGLPVHGDHPWNK